MTGAAAAEPTDPSDPTDPSGLPPADAGVVAWAAGHDLGFDPDWLRAVSWDNAVRLFGPAGWLRTTPSHRRRCGMI